MKRTATFVVFVAVALGAALVARGQGPKSVVVIAPSVSTSMEARNVRAKLGWSETANWRTADGILVVVRSMLLNPLRSRYECACEMKDDAERQLNISGQNFHVYVYRLDDDLSVTQTAHQSWEAR